MLYLHSITLTAGVKYQNLYPDVITFSLLYFSEQKIIASANYLLIIIIMRMTLRISHNGDNPAEDNPASDNRDLTV